MSSISLDGRPDEAEASSTRCHVLVVDHDSQVVEQLAGIVHSLGHVATTSTDKFGLLRTISRGDFDAIVLCRVAPSVNDATLLKQLYAGKVVVPILILELSGGPHWARGMMTGLRASLNILSSGWRGQRAAQDTEGQSDFDTPGTMIRAGDISVDPIGRLAWLGTKVVKLSPLEMRLLIVLARNAGAVCTRARLLKEVWDTSATSPSNVVAVQIRRLRSKLAQGTTPGPIRTLRGIGYMLDIQQNA